MTEFRTGGSAGEPASVDAAAPEAGHVILDQYIVVLSDDVTDVHGVAAELAHAAGASVRFVYTSALRGFAAYNVPAAGLARLIADPRVKYVERDRVARTMT